MAHIAHPTTKARRLVSRAEIGRYAYSTSLTVAASLMDGVSKGMRRVPQTARYHAADALARGIQPLLRKRLVVITENYAVMLGTSRSDERVRRLAQASIANYVRMALDFLAVRTMSEADMLAWTVGVGEQYFQQALAAGRGVIFAVPHHGSWDVAAVYAQAYGCKLTVVTESNWVTELVAGSRTGHGVALAPRDKSLRLLFKALARNECVVMLSDIANDGVQTLDVPFFGRPAPFPMGPARLAQHTGAPILVISSVRLPDLTYCVQADPPLWPDRKAPVEAEVTRLTSAIASGFERTIAAYPDQWYPFHPIWPQVAADQSRHA